MLRSWKAGAVTAALGAIALLGGGSSTAEARGDLVVKRFLIGRLEPNTDRFIATGGRGTQNVFRDAAQLFVQECSRIRFCVHSLLLLDLQLRLQRLVLLH